jgi:tRNA threonylcarbamoyladenosine biosynthesis protein TsaE
MKNSLRVRVLLRDPQSTARLAASLAEGARCGDIIALRGDLGAGKTTFARGFISALLGEEEVQSPTFSLVQTYEPKEGPAPAVWHFDLYRLESPAEAVELGIDEAFDEGVSLIEWPERLGSYLPEDHLKLGLSFGAGETERLAELEGGSSWVGRLKDLVQKLPEATFVTETAK